MKFSGNKEANRKTADTQQVKVIDLQIQWEETVELINDRSITNCVEFKLRTPHSMN